jgi:L-fuculose-phosphate aldolase
MSQWQNEKEQVLKVARQMLAEGLVVGTAGNVSMRLPPFEGREIIAITPHHIYYDLMTPDDIVIMDYEGESQEGDIPSVEAMLHVGIYQARKNVKAVIHTHSVYASAFAVAGRNIPAILDEQVTYLGGEVRLAKYAVSGSEELANNVVQALGKNNAVLLPSHGMVGVGRSLREALTVCQLVERTAQIFQLAHTLGRAILLPPDVVEAEQAFFEMLQSGEE